MNRMTAWLPAGFGGVLVLLGLMAAGPAPKTAPPGRSNGKVAVKKTAAAAGAGKRLSEAEAQAFWRQYHFGALWQLKPGSGAVSGFFGAEGVRIQFALLQVSRDASQPNLYHVRGKTRCASANDKIIPFAGTILLKQVTHADDKDWDVAAAYAVTGSFAFQEAKAAPGTGSFRGTVAVTVAPNGPNSLRLLTNHSRDGRMYGQGYKFEGQWANAAGRVESVVWGDNWYRLGEQLFSDFDLGDRMPTLNPKYADRGWYSTNGRWGRRSFDWQNEEWWHDTADAPIGPSL